MPKRCTYCKGTDFSVLVEAVQEWDSELDEWNDVEVLNVLEKKDTYLCKTCEMVFKSKVELEDYELEYIIWI